MTPADAYVHQEFPKWKYSADGKSVTVADAVEEEALEGGPWYNSPTEASKAAENPAPAPAPAPVEAQEKP